MTSTQLFTIGGSLATLYNGSTAISHTYDPYNPLNLPPYVIRVRTNDNNPPNNGYYQFYGVYSAVEGENSVYDISAGNSTFAAIIRDSTNSIEVLGANPADMVDLTEMCDGCYNISSIALFDTSRIHTMEHTFRACTALTSLQHYDTSNVTNMNGMCWANSHLSAFPELDTSNVTTMEGMLGYCDSLSSIPLFDTSNVTNIMHMCELCTALTSIPLFNTRNVSLADEAFAGCYSVRTGALALYNQMSQQNVQYHKRMFNQCGNNNSSGQAELAQIPDDWK